MKPLNLFAFSDFKSQNVIDVIGHEYGTIKDILINPESNRIMFVVVSSGGFAGTELGSEYIPVPWHMVRVNPHTNTCSLEVARDKINNAPRVDYDELKEGKEKVLHEIYNYYGYPDFWESKERTIESIKTSEPIKDKHEGYMGDEKITKDAPNDESRLGNDMDFDKLTGK